MRLLAFAVTTVFVWTGPKSTGAASKESGKSLSVEGLVRTSFIFYMELWVREACEGAHKLRSQTTLGN